jgi:hypothetical protein
VAPSLLLRASPRVGSRSPRRGNGGQRQSAGRGDKEQPEREKVRGSGGVEEGERESGGAKGGGGEGVRVHRLGDFNF